LLSARRTLPVNFVLLLLLDAAVAVVVVVVVLVVAVVLVVRMQYCAIVPVKKLSASGASLCAGAVACVRTALRKTPAVRSLLLSTGHWLQCHVAYKNM
jgi:hypothetical protein